MALPPTVRVKLSSEGAESISITPVVVRDMPLRELVEYMLGITGKDQARIHELLLRGSLVSGASRFRWTGWAAPLHDLHVLLTTFPDPNPSLPFDPARCIRAILRGGRQPIQISRDAATRKPLLRRETFWDVLLRVVSSPEPVYSGYSYREHADRYLREFTFAELGQLRTAGALVRYTSLSDQIRTFGYTQAELFVQRAE